MALNKAREAFRGEDFAAARDFAQQAAQTDPKNPDVFLLLGRADLQLGNVDEALSALRTVLKLAPAQEYAKRMVASLEGRMQNVEQRLQLVQELIDSGLLESASRELSAIQGSLALDDRHRLDLLRTQAEYAVQAGDGPGALKSLNELIIRDPKQAESLPVRLLFARARVAVGGDEVANGLSQLQEIVEKSGDTPQGREAQLALLSYRLARGESVVKDLSEWIAANPAHRGVHRARKGQRAIVAMLLKASAERPTPTENSTLNQFDEAALAATAEALKAFAQPDDQTALVQSLLNHFESRYAANGAYAAALAGIDAVHKLTIPQNAEALVSAVGRRVLEAQATAEFQALANRIREAAATPAELAKWIEDHADHPQASAARQLLISAYLNVTTRAAAPKRNSQLSEADTAAIKAAGEYLATLKTSEAVKPVIEQLVAHLRAHYVARAAYSAALAGVEQLVALELPKPNRLQALLALLQLQGEAAIDGVQTHLAAGTLQGGPLPDLLAAMMKTATAINKEYPATPAWNHQIQVAEQLLTFSGQYAWPTKMTAAKPMHLWAVELALPVVSGSRQAETIARAKQAIDTVVAECLAVPQESARGIAIAIHGQLLDATATDQAIWPAVVTHHVELLTAQAAAEFAENVRSGESGKNAKLTETQTQILQLLTKLVSERPSQAMTALQQLDAHLQQWLAAGHDTLVENAYATFAEKLPGPQQRLTRLKLSELWFAQVVREHSQILANGFQVPAKLHPLAEKALVECYNLTGTLGLNDPLLASIQQLRQRIINHYLEFEYYDVAEAAIRVQGEPVVASQTETMELELADLKGRLAFRQLQQQLQQHNGRDKLALTPPFNETIAAYKKFITDHPHSVRVSTAVDAVFSIGKTFENYQAWKVAAQVYADFETFAATVESLATPRPHEWSTAERAAVARASVLHTLASHELAKWNADKPDNAPPPEALSEEFQAAIAAWQKIITDYRLRPVAHLAIGKVMSIAMEYAALNAWDVAENVYAALIEMELPLRSPERLEFARAICQLGKVMPAHARDLLAALSIGGTPGDKSDASGDGQMLALNGPPVEKSVAAGEESESKLPVTEDRPVETPTSSVASAPTGTLPSVDGFAVRGGKYADVNELDNRWRSDSDARLFAAVQNQLAQQARQVAMLRDEAISHRMPHREEAAQDPTQAAIPALLSDAELTRQQQILDAVYTSLQAIRKKYEHAPTSTQAREEIFVIANHWRSIQQWNRAAELARRYLADNPTDINLPNVRQEIARDLLAWASQSLQKERLSKQEMLDEISKRFDAARDELQAIVAAFPEENTLRQQAQWDIANSFLTQARVISEASPTLARGQFVRAATELLRVAELYHDHPQIGSIPNMLWSISEELTARGYHDEAITVWNELTIHYPTQPLADQAALRIAQTWQQLGQPLRAVEAFLELNFARGGNDGDLQNTIYQIAVQLKNEKRWIESLHVLETFVDSFPSHGSAGQALTMIGQIHQENEVWEDAIAAYRRVIDEFASGVWTVEARWAIAECTINLSRWQAAIGAYVQFQQSYPQDGRVAEAARRIEILKTLDRYQDVVDEEGQPKAFDAQFQIATIVRTQLANPVKAIIEYRKVAANWPQSHLADDALFEIGEIYLERGETELARTALLRMAERYPESPQADDALLLVGRSYVNEADRLAAVDRNKSAEMARDIAQREAYLVARDNRRMQVERNLDQLKALKSEGKDEEAANKEASLAAQVLQFEAANTAVISNWAAQQEEALTAAQLADRQDRINAALRKAVLSFRKAAEVTSADKADDALLQMAQIYDERLKDAESAMATWEEIVKQYSGTTVAEDASWKMAEYYEKHEQHGKAIDAYQTFLRNYRRSPRADRAQAAIAENYEHLGQWVQAMDAYTNYLNNFPEGALAKKAREQISWIKTYRL